MSGEPAATQEQAIAAVNQIVEQGKERLAQGLWVLVFPEGTRVTQGEKRKYGVSGALLASRAGVMIVPVVHTAGHYWPRRGWVKRPGVIRVAIGKPINAAGRDPRELNEEVRAWIDARLASLDASEAGAGSSLSS